MLEKPRGKRITRYRNSEEEGVGRVVNLQAMNENQKTYLKALKTAEQILVVGF